MGDQSLQVFTKLENIATDIDALCAIFETRGIVTVAFSLNASALRVTLRRLNDLVLGSAEAFFRLSWDIPQFGILETLDGMCQLRKGLTDLETSLSTARVDFNKPTRHAEQDGDDEQGAHMLYLWRDRLLERVKRLEGAKTLATNQWKVNCMHENRF